MYDIFMDAIQILPVTNPNASIIWMHGLGASGKDFLPILDLFKLNKDLSIRFIFPNAPIRPISINNGMKMQAWYDIKDFTEIFQDHEHTSINNSHLWITESQEMINKFILREIEHGIPSSKIILIGFSQGGALALYTGLRSNIKLGGIICLSGYLPLHALIKHERSLVNQDTPILFAHGTIDPIIPIVQSKKSYDLLDKLGYNVRWKSYFMPHVIMNEEIIDLSNFVNQVLSV